MSGLRSRSAWFVDTGHERPKLFRAGADTYCDGDHRSDTDHRTICHCNRDGDRDRNFYGDRDGDIDSD